MSVSQKDPVGEEIGKVLVIDDDPGCALAMARILAKHDVTVVHSGQAALEVLESPESYDVVLCDLVMPGIGGREIYHRMVDRRPGVAAQMIFVTGGAYTRQASAFLGAIPNRKIDKPFSIREVRQAVAEHVARLPAAG